MEPRFNAPAPSQIIQGVAPPTLEARLRHLEAGVDRLQRLRARLEYIADAISVDPTNRQPTPGASPPSNDLSGRFGDAIDYAHNILEEIERLTQRIDSALFEQKAAQSAVGRG